MILSFNGISIFPAEVEREVEREREEVVGLEYLVFHIAEGNSTKASPSGLIHDFIEYKTSVSIHIFNNYNMSRHVKAQKIIHG